MHIAVFSQYHTNPDCPATSRHYSLLAHLAKSHRVTLITTRTWETQRLTHLYPWLPEGVEMRAAEVPYANKMGVARRVLAFGQYAAYAVREGLRLERPDVIWGISTPLTAAWAAAQVARQRRVPWVFEVQDLWPSFPIAMGAVPTRFAQNRLFALEKSLYRSAQHILPLSPDMTRYVQAQGIAPEKITTVLNGTDLELAALATPEAVEALRQAHGLAGKQVVLYAGTFGRANDIPTLVAAAELLALRRPNVVWLFMGLGFHEPLVRAAAARCTSIRLVPPQPRHTVFGWFRLADMSVVSFLNLPVLDANSPAKFYDSLAVGTPVVVTNQGWTKALVEQYGCGWYAPAGDADALAACLQNILAQPETLRAAGENGRQVAAAQFDRQQIAATVQRVLEAATSQSE
ncbi:Glycosyltransferase involved in cell wall bisynthesis [Hymenobacter daecheongensis DSM 21074]|uniref:Glycosyltransferase involved in cell wall bisynthesis n=1 Tax=Hymenobacter daecheongensis DSM 21074 TaxID=1121955 RepID=A0A1M6A1U3_9BACT|nr:glycosyltransferase family 4 protein [Hymenobacter daecheongensis]SHI30173.1 Glycosyltransferase involved in cell wall bisynthesis [Hymenobacter daecheongensis DSM 21074]